MPNESAQAEHQEPEDDAILVARAKADRQAFAALYARYFSAVLRFCEARLRDRAEAEDATSQVFTKAMVALPSCNEQAFRGWLFTIARNVVTDVYRRRATRPSNTLDEADAVPDSSPSPEEIALIEDDRRTMWELLVHLTPDQRRVVELRLAGLTGPEIAVALGISHSSVKVHQFRAVQRLRGVITQQEADQEEADNALNAAPAPVRWLRPEPSPLLDRAASVAVEPQELARSPLPFRLTTLARSGGIK